MTSAILTSELFTQTPQGTYRLANTRVSLDSVIYAFWNGATPEEIVQSFPVLPLAQVYSCIGYYLAHQEPVDAYMREQEQSAEQLQKELRENEAPEFTALRKRLLAHRESQSESA